MGMSSFYVDHDHKATEEENWKVIERAQELGVTFLDTSDVYGPHTNEEMLGTPILFCNTAASALQH